MQSPVAESSISTVEHRTGAASSESEANQAAPSKSDANHVDHMNRSSSPTPEVQMGECKKDQQDTDVTEYQQNGIHGEGHLETHAQAAHLQNHEQHEGHAQWSGDGVEIPSQNGDQTEERDSGERKCEVDNPVHQAEETGRTSHLQNGGLYPEQNEDAHEAFPASSVQCIDNSTSSLIMEMSSLRVVLDAAPAVALEQGRSEPESSLPEQTQATRTSPSPRDRVISSSSMQAKQSRSKGPRLQSPKAKGTEREVTTPTSASSAKPKGDTGKEDKDSARFAKSVASTKTSMENISSPKFAVSKVKSKEADATKHLKDTERIAEAVTPLSRKSSSEADNKLQNGGKDKMQRPSSRLPPISCTENTPPAKDKDKICPNPTSPSTSSPKASTVSSLRPPASSFSSSSERIPTPAGVRTSPNRPTSRFVDLKKHVPSSPGSARKILENGMSPEHNDVVHQRRASLEGDRLPSKLKELFPRRNSIIGMGGRKFRDSESVVSSEHTSVLVRESADLGPFLLKLAKQAVTSGDNLHKALDYASRAAKSFENTADGKPSLDLVMSLHILAAIHCTLGQFEEAIPVLKHSIMVPDIEGGGEDHALAVFAGNMQLGDTYALLGRGDDALAAYHAGLEVQKRALGEKDPRVGETCRYLAEAHTQAMQFDKAEELCQHALDIHKEHSPPASIEEATDRRLMGLICNAKGQFEVALEHLVLASMALIANGKDVDVASVDVSIGDAYVSLGRYDEAVFAYQKALTVFKSSEGENHVSVASVYVSLAEAYLKIGKIREAKTYCESALRIYNKQGAGNQLNEVASGLTDLAVVYEALSEQEQALALLKKALVILETVPGQQSAIAGVEAQIGVLNYMRGNYVDARSSFSKAILKLRASAEKNTALFGIVLNQMGLSCLHLSDIGMAVKLFEESREVLETVCGPHHPDTLSVYSNLAAAYDASGRLDDAINSLQYVVEVREEELGTAEPEVEDERNRLAELLKEAGRLRARRLNNTLGLLMQPKTNSPAYRRPGHCVNASVSVPVNV